MSNFKVYDPSTNTAVDIASLFVRRAYISGLSQVPDVNTYRLYTWGYGGNGGLGSGATTNRSSPAQTLATYTNWKQVATNGINTIAIRTDGTMWSTGQGTFGMIGDGTNVAKSSPVQIAGTTWSQVSMSPQYAVALKTDGSLWQWGSFVSTPAQVFAGSTWTTVAVGTGHFAAIKPDGTLWLWGQNGSGQLGDNTTTTRNSPVQTAAGGTWTHVSVGANSTAAVKSDGTLWTWGDNASGQLGDNTIVAKSSPVQTVAGGNTWKQSAMAEGVCGGIKTDGTLWMWGSNVYGQIGDNTIASKSSPVQTVAGGNNWARLATSNYLTGAIKTDGTLWLWGYNISGQLGDNTSASKSSPVQTVAGGGNWYQVAVGRNDIAAAIQYTTGS